MKAPKRFLASMLYNAVRSDGDLHDSLAADAPESMGQDRVMCKSYLKKLRSLQFTQALHITIDVLNILSDISCTFQKDELLITDIAVKLGAGLIKWKVLKQLNGKSFTEYTALAETQPCDIYTESRFVEFRTPGRHLS